MNYLNINLTEILISVVVPCARMIQVLHEGMFNENCRSGKEEDKDARKGFEFIHDAPLEVYPDMVI